MSTNCQNVGLMGRVAYQSDDDHVIIRIQLHTSQVSGSDATDDRNGRKYHTNYCRGDDTSSSVARYVEHGIVCV